MNRLKKLRLEKNESLESIAKILNVTLQTISNYENEKREMTPNTILKLAEYFNVSTDYLLGKSDIRNPEEQIKQEFEFAYHKEMEGLSDEEIADALRFYKQIKYGNKENKSDN
jgi:transcriptional regulator with XRE-family HTH domain|uniref:Helix-turn-helix domain protein n=1 Tax=Myoviridae sp. ct8mY9 TaxID=2827664 RepID=A0A8S5SFF2_9CAUD|nr:MAG TPA: helix-turn-helix domain protein [Myoviridae sp. ct8mY9]